jgi:hypothetical protein
VVFQILFKGYLTIRSCSILLKTIVLQDLILRINGVSPKISFEKEEYVKQSTVSTTINQIPF